MGRQNQLTDYEFFASYLDRIRDPYRSERSIVVIRQVKPRSCSRKSVFGGPMVKGFRSP